MNYLHQIEQLVACHLCIKEKNALLLYRHYDVGNLFK